jgi:CDGSH-type Zn-finger protein/uncharacterized Fe-S cluster protein YjdI
MFNPSYLRNQEGIQMPQRMRTYTGQSIDVTYEAGRCIHVAECLRRLPTVFDKSKRPWVQTDNEAADTVATTVLACPSGALHYTRKDGGEAEALPDHNTIRITRNGPLHIRGDLTIVNSAGEVILNDTRATLCRCGASANKPFCDNSHITIGFQAPATIDDAQTTSPREDSGKLTIETTLNGPLHISGNFTVLNGRGERIAQGTDESFCRCGASEHKPFCDDSHRRIGFVAE